MIHEHIQDEYLLIPGVAEKISEKKIAKCITASPTLCEKRLEQFFNRMQLDMYTACVFDSDTPSTKFPYF